MYSDISQKRAHLHNVNTYYTNYDITHSLHSFVENPRLFNELTLNTDPFASLNSLAVFDRACTLHIRTKERIMTLKYDKDNITLEDIYKTIMDSKETSWTTYEHNALIYNDEYFKYIFKKTEKIVSAVLYTTRSMSAEVQKDILVRITEERSQGLMELAEKTLRTGGGGKDEALMELRVALVGLESSLSFLVSARIMREELFEVFAHELGSLQRGARDYIGSARSHSLESLFGVRDTLDRKRVQGERNHPRRERVSVQSETGVALPSRRDRVLNIIKEKGHVTIKDISLAVTDVSEKTIQRELMTLINEGQIIKTGERRWSRYSMSV